ncbi:DNA mismatch repair protein MutT [Stenotrophomonas panacihumi]|uniref:8-oxo-dGTP diphosphatase n=1 Tax=Stenotrophomonas panacihumi TaxID=676599 RepID=A0A0R0ACK6_9GAMM|nr:Nudix family hydrolase [Stenotrophomonas panacihumi]KRG39255.1 DNA mismatch repair protein MutT [Stenotrophomonas panacihumi]PTN55254.1 Nudix family hydrolase [Stenotrophomonas panacihumi]
MPDSLRSIHVVAGVIRDARGRILLTRRTETRDMPGLWEFPGGKREAGESSEQALARELHEELGIEAEVGEWLMEVPQRYPDKRLRLEVRMISAWKGQPRGREGQALTWVPSERLSRYSMPPADVPVVAALRQPDRYLVTPEPEDAEAWLRHLGIALDEGVRRVHLRARHCEPARWRALLEAVRERFGRRDVQWLLNRDIALARELGFGVHLGSEQLASLDARPLPAEVPLAASCHHADDLRRAQALGCDFAVLGPVLPTASHPGEPAMGWEGFEALRESVSLPLYAIGGLGPEHVPMARHHGAQGIAAIRALWPADLAEAG